MQDEGSENRYIAEGIGPYTVARALSTGEYTSGQYTYTAVAYDNKGGKSFSSPVTLTYTRNTPPIVTLTIIDADRDSGTPPTSSEAITLRADAIDSDGTVREVRFYEVFESLGGYKALLGTVQQKTYGAYELSLGPRSTGQHTFIAQAVDNLNTDSLSTSSSMTVIPAPLGAGAPIVIKAGVVTMDGTAQGKITVKRGGVTIIADCTTQCEDTASVGDTLDFIATATTPIGSRFSGWGGIPRCINQQPQSGVETEATCTLKADSDVVANAGFTMVCTDSDNGDVPSVAGTTSKHTITKKDICTNSQGNKILTEYYCQSGSIVEKSYRCSSCNNGICTDPIPT